MGEPAKEPEEKKRSMIQVDPAVHSELSAAAAEGGHKITWLASKLIRDGLAKREASKLAASA